MSLTAVVDILSEFSSDPQTMASAIAAIYRMQPNSETLEAAVKHVDPQLITLAALQCVDFSKLDLSHLPIDAEKASDELLKLALVVVGLNRSPANLFHSRHENSDVVRSLGGHHNEIVSQYTVWAITENNNLGLKDLGIDLKTIEDTPPNVRSWMYRLIASKSDDISKHFEYIELGSRDPDSDARLGLATGLREAYFDGIEPFILDWFYSEDCPEVSHALIDHVIRQSPKAINYFNTAIEFYEKESGSSPRRLRMEGAAIGLPIYSRMKAISVDGAADLFRGTIIVNTTNINGGVQGGSISINGDSNNSGDVKNSYDAKTVETINSILSDVIRTIHNADLPSEAKSSLLREAEAAQRDPNPANMKSLAGTLETAGKLASGGADGIALAKYGWELIKFLGLG
ncbi:hypothetical protein V5F31_07840 [Xanthobacter sp. V7C-4]|uniref:hypothetical protein n=1 Tax=Xanthobacter autotrophicus (strain ATCC BAA-1158 / Py2) TaxID=78245 RepID=UPI00372A1675